MKVFLRVVVALAMVVGLLLSPPASAQAASLPTPTGLTALSTSKSGVSLRWNAVAGAPKYRIQYSTSSSMKNAKYVRVSGTIHDLTGLKPSTTYYVKVRVITATGGNLSPYSKAVKVKTRAKSSYSLLSPVALAAEAVTASSMSLTWATRGSNYRIAYATKSNFSDVVYRRFASMSATISSLKPATTYYVKVRSITADGVNLSAYSPTIKLTTAKAAAPATPAPTPATPAPTTPAPAKPIVTPATPLRVVSYNVRCANCFGGQANEGTWYERRDTVVAAIKDQAPDVIGLQEASQGWLKNDAGKSISLSQFEDLTNRLGSPYKLTNANRNNCVKATTPTNCVYKDQGASQGTKIVYNSSTLTLVKQGSVRLAEVKASDNDRYVAWAIFTQKATGKKFFFADTHLDNTPSGSDVTAYYNARVQQTQGIIAAIAEKNTDKLPVFLVGDLNSSKWSSPVNAPYDLLQAAGYVDPLGNYARSTSQTRGATVERRINTNISSYNGFARKVPVSSYVNGTYIDYIWTSPGVRVQEWETVIDMDASGNYIDPIPSDHNMLRATTYLP